VGVSVAACPHSTTFHFVCPPIRTRRTRYRMLSTCIARDAPYNDHSVTSHVVSVFFVRGCISPMSLSLRNNKRQLLGTIVTCPPSLPVTPVTVFGSVSIIPNPTTTLFPLSAVRIRTCYLMQSGRVVMFCPRRMHGRFGYLASLIVKAALRLSSVLPSSSLLCLLTCPVTHGPLSCKHIYSDISLGAQT